MKKNQGKIIQIIGAVVDVYFPEKLPALLNALEVKNEITNEVLTLEVVGQLGGGKVRAIALGPTDGLKRGMIVDDLEKPISVPVGKEVLGRVLNVVGKPIDGKDEPKVKEYWPIHRPAPDLLQQEVKQEILETGLKVIDLIAPFVREERWRFLAGREWERQF